MWHQAFRASNLPTTNDVVLLELLLILQPIQLIVNESDRFVLWKNSKGFAVKASYKRILEAHNCNWVVDAHRYIALNSLWKTKVSSKVLIFCWRLILNRLPTMMELARQGVLMGSHNLVCPLCFGGKEDLDHLFGECPISKLLLRKICD